MIYFFILIGAKAEEEDAGTVEADLGASREASRTDDEVVGREEEAIKLDGLSVAEVSFLIYYFKIYSILILNLFQNSSKNYETNQTNLNSKQKSIG